ncbi:hypothetical protein LTR28_003105 [Elasticomyces elasticus]|nr:hypothetical protein LTR28_003105 [Elasticomyces elasticus]
MKGPLEFPHSLLVLALLSSTLCQANIISDFNAKKGSTSDELVTDPPLSLPQALISVFEILRSVESLPSCHRVASAALLNSCSSLEASPRDDNRNRGSDIMLNEVKSVYAARLAVCEFSDAKVAVPQACLPFVPTERTTKKHGIRGFLTRKGPTQATDYYLDYDDITEGHLTQCLTALESKPQWWTSYSNARQNAVIMCHSMRTEVEKDEQISIYSDLASAAEHLTSGLSGAVADMSTVRDQLEELPARFRHFFSTLTGEMQRDMELQQESSHSVFNKLMSSIQSVASLVMQNIEHDASRVSTTLAQAKRDADDTAALNVENKQQVREVAEAFANTAAQVGLSIATAQGKAMDAADVIQYIYEYQLQQLQQGLGTMENSLQASNTYMIAFQERMNEMEQFFFICLSFTIFASYLSLGTILRLGANLDMQKMLAVEAGVAATAQNMTAIKANVASVSEDVVTVRHDIQQISQEAKAANADIKGLIDGVAVVTNTLGFVVDVIRSTTSAITSFLRAPATFVGGLFGALALTFTMYQLCCWIIRRRHTRTADSHISLPNLEQPGYNFRLKVNNPKAFRNREM